MRTAVLIVVLLSWLLEVSVLNEVSFDQKLYVVFLHDSLIMTLNFSNQSFRQSYQVLKFMVGNISVMTCERASATIINPTCVIHYPNLFRFRNAIIRGDKMEIQVDSATRQLGDKVSANFISPGFSYSASSDVLVLDEPTCNATFRIIAPEFEAPFRRTTRVVPVQEDTELNENTAIQLECSIISHHSSGKIPAFPSWKGATAILLKVSSTVYHQRPLLSTQTATLIVRKISYFESIACEIQTPICVPGKDGCHFYPNNTIVPGGDDDDYIDYDDYETDGLLDDDLRTSSSCLRNARKCKCFIKTPKLSYCSDEVNIVEERQTNGSVRLTCRVRLDVSHGNFTPRLRWTSSDPSFSSSESIIIVNRAATYRCISTLPLGRHGDCEINFKTHLDIGNYTTHITEVIVVTRYRLHILAGVALFFLGLFCLASVLFMIKGVMENNKKALKEMGLQRYPRSGSMDRRI